MGTRRSIMIAILAAATLASGVGCAPAGTSRQTTAAQVDDAAITARVKTALIQERGVKAGELNVETFRGVVSLSGFVDTQSMAEKAVNAAKNVDGVRSVKNDMRLKSAS